MRIDLKSIELPDPLARAMQRRASDNKVTIEEQVVRDLTRIELDLHSLTREELLELVSRDRDAMAQQGVWLNEEALREAKEWGRK